jgi:hypothetical protein
MHVLIFFSLDHIGELRLFVLKRGKSGERIQDNPLIPAIREEKAAKITTKESPVILLQQPKQSKGSTYARHDQRITPRAFGLQPNTTASSLL